MSSAAKHVLNDPATLVVDSLKGLATLNPEVKLDEASRGESVPSGLVSQDSKRRDADAVLCSRLPTKQEQGRSSLRWRIGS